jgi:hypothetical protein
MRYARAARVWWTVMLVPFAASASVGSVSAIEGTAQRTSRDGRTSPLAAGAAVELGDVIRVKQGALKLTLNDASVVMLAQGADLEITEAEFAGQDRQSFVAKLGLGALWAKVSKAAAGSNAKFEIQTERAVAGVRGTIFQVEAVDSADAHETRVGVIEGKVAVDRRVAPPLAVATATSPPIRPGGAGAPGLAAPTASASKPAAMPAAPVSGMLLTAGEGVRVNDEGLSRGRLRPLPAGFERFIAQNDADHAHDVERRDTKRDDERERRHER